MKNETQASTQQIYKAFRKLTQHVLNTYRKPPVTLTNNLYNGLQQAIKNREEKKYFGPDELWKPRETRTTRKYRRTPTEHLQNNIDPQKQDDKLLQERRQRFKRYVRYRDPARQKKVQADISFQ